MPRILLIICLHCILLFPKTGKGQIASAGKDNNKLTTKQKLIIGGLALQQAGSLLLEYKWWWKDDYHPFIIENDGGVNNYSLGMDKVGHFYMSYLYFTTLNELMRWGEFSDKARIWTSMALPAAWAVSIEIGDGFSSYGFSFYDLTANFMGIGYGILQERLPYMRNFNFKFSYYPSPYYLNNDFKGWGLSNDYDGHIYWLSFNVHGLLGEKAKRFWPACLNLACGYGVNGFESYNADKIQREFFIGLDYNLGAIQTKNTAVNAVRNILDKFHYPAPGIKINADGSWDAKLFLVK